MSTECTTRHIANQNSELIFHFHFSFFIFHFSFCLQNIYPSHRCGLTEHDSQQSYAYSAIMCLS